MTVEDYLALEFVPVVLDLVMFDHDDYEIYVGEERVKVVVLVLDHVLIDERVVNLERFSKVTLLALK